MSKVTNISDAKHLGSIGGPHDLRNVLTTLF